MAVLASRSKTLDKDKKIVIYCNSGGRIDNAYRKLTKMAYRDIYQPILAKWKEAELPVDH